MKTRLFRCIALCLTLCFLLSGCNLILNSLLGTGYTSFPDMKYTRPNVDEFIKKTAECAVMSGKTDSVTQLMEYVYPVFTMYSDFQTSYVLADIHYCQNVNDLYWKEEYEYCVGRSSDVSAAMDQLLYTLADCKLREQLESDLYFGAGYFDAYEGESVWSEAFTALMNQEAELLNRYYQLSADSAATSYYSEEFFTTYGDDFIQLYVDLVLLRQQIAAEAGYEGYSQFAYDFYYGRDFTSQQALVLLKSIRDELVEPYTQYCTAYPQMSYASESDVLAYLKSCTDAMGGTFAAAYALMQQRQLYDITYSENKYDASFEVFIPNYYVPFIFVNPSAMEYDKLTLAHEFGHFCTDYAASGTYTSIDIAEIFSQATEYLSLCYSQDKDLAAFKMRDGLSTFVEQSAYAYFEEMVYAMDPEELTPEAVVELYGSICADFGQDIWERDSRDFILIPHLYTNPMYVLSYVISNDAALQIYQAELDEAGSGLEIMEKNLATSEWYFLTFLNSAGLDDPFQENRGQQILETLLTLTQVSDTAIPKAS